MWATTAGLCVAVLVCAPVASAQVVTPVTAAPSQTFASTNQVVLTPPMTYRLRMGLQGQQFAHNRSAVIDLDQALTRLGIELSPSSPRDTLGLLITGITPNGPADNAGLEEGDRITSVNGVNLKLASVDASDDEMHGLMAKRLERVVEKVPPDGSVALAVVQDGEMRTVTLQLGAPVVLYVEPEAKTEAAATVVKASEDNTTTPQKAIEASPPAPLDVPPPPASDTTGTAH